MTNETKDRGLNKEQITSIFKLFKYLKENNQVLDPVAWKTRAIKLNYFVAGVPVVYGLLASFHIIPSITPEMAIDFLGFLAALAPLANTVILACTSKNITLNPVRNSEIVAERAAQRALNNPLLDEDSDE